MIIKVIRIIWVMIFCSLPLAVLANNSVVEPENKTAVATQNNEATNGISAVDNMILGDDSSPPVLNDNGAVSASSHSLVERKPQVGKHVMANMNAGSMILSLLMVLGLIIVCAFVLKHFNLAQQSVSQLKLVTSLRLGTKERVIVVQVGEQQLLLGVTGQQITLLDKLDEPLTNQANQNSKTADLPKSILSFLSNKKMS